MTETQLPIALRASDVPVRAQRSIYPEPFASMMAGRDKRQLGEAFGLANFGVNLTTLAPGAMSALRHAHSRQDEFVYILEGEATLVTDAPVVYLEIGDRSPDDQPVWPDVDLQLLDVGGKRVFAHRDGRLY